MAHDLIQVLPDLNTLISTSVESYIFTCTQCNKQERYAYSNQDNIEVFCDGVDFGTKVKIGGVVIEIFDVNFMKEKFTTDDFTTESTQNLIDLNIIEPLSRQTDDEMVENGYTLTELGKQIMKEL